MPPWRIQHESHTCSEQSLRIQVECILRAKTLQLYLTGMGQRKDPRRYRTVSIAKAWQIAETVQSTKWHHMEIQKLELGFKSAKIDMPVLGLAGCYFRKWNDWQVRGVDQIPYPSQLHGASLATAMQRPCRPCYKWQIEMSLGFEETTRPRDLKKWKLKNRCTSTTTGRSFTSIQMFHTHTCLDTHTR